MALLELRDIFFSYRHAGAVPILRGVSLSIREGEMVAIQGPSGSGKSTLFYVIGCLLKPDGGSVLLEGEDLACASRDRLALIRNRKIGFVFQQFHLLSRATVLENILLPTRYPAESAHTTAADRARALTLARRLGIEDRLTHLPNQLSGGQQQRVAIARALMNDVSLILADEPTGNLDSKSASETLALLRELNRRGKTVVIITHDGGIASACDRVLHMRDGLLVRGEELPPAPAGTKAAAAGTDPGPSLSGAVRALRASLPLSWENIRRNKAKSAATMLGVTIGIAAVLAMVTLGAFTKTKVLASYEALGANKLMFTGRPNWQLRAVDRVGVPFQGFDWERDIERLPEVFPEIERYSPSLRAWSNTIVFGGKSLSEGIRSYGVSADYLDISNRQLALGMPISPHHVAGRNAVCLIGWEIAEQLFWNVNPLGQMLWITDSGRSPYSCKILGVLKAQQSNNEWQKPNLQILLPFTFFQSVNNQWDAQIHEVALKIRPGVDVEALGKRIRAFFRQKYGKSGRFNVDSDAVLLDQMKRFLTLFTVMLTSIALLSLLVGGIGITNMMLVSVAERCKEIGLRKAIGATDRSIRIQLLLESVLLCGLAGVIGVAFGFVSYEAILFGAAKFFTKVKFEWVIEPSAILLSTIAIVAVGVASGLVPALRAEKLEVVEALRSE